jgi:predicted acetyltransferase
MDSRQIAVDEFCWLDTDAYRSIWTFLAKHDLVGHVAVVNLPVDDPAPAIFQEPRLLKMREAEGTWWRIVNVTEALEGRTYRPPMSLQSCSSLTLSVSDDERLAPWNIGTFVLTLDAQGTATCRRTGSGLIDVDVTVGIPGLTNLWAGAASARTIAGWGLLTASSDEALQRADTIFATAAAPHCFDYW